MAELKNRNQLDRRFAREFAKLTAKQKRELKRLMGKPPDIANVPAAFWVEAQRETEQELAALMLLVFIAASQQHGMSKSASQTQGLVFAVQKSKQVATQFVTHTRERLAAGGDLETVLGPSRVSVVAETEVTAAQAQGIDASIASGDIPNLSFGAPFWFTKCDPKVCIICWPYHGVPAQIWRPRISFPAHPHCRCFPSVLRVGRVAGRIRVNDCPAPEGADFTLRRQLVSESNRILGFDN